jgi:hypothetical protein
LPPHLGSGKMNFLAVAASSGQTSDEWRASKTTWLDPRRGCDGKTLAEIQKGGQLNTSFGP